MVPHYSWMTITYTYLGIYIHHKLSWQPQVDYVCSKANRILGFLWQNLRGSSRTLRETSYLHFVLPILDYCCSIWDPYHPSSVHKLEMIQHQVTHFVLNKPWRTSLTCWKYYNGHHCKSAGKTLVS